MDSQRFPCKNCGAELEFKPGADALTCPYCGHETPVEQAEEATVEELDFHEHLAQVSEQAESEERTTLHCEACGAEVTLDPDVTSDECPFCGSRISAETTSTKVIKPRSLLPFKIAKDEAVKSFRQWLRKLWFAPNKVKRYAQMGGINGMYIPYWTYDCETTSHYSGERGDDYWATESYTENGQVKTRRVRKTRWHRVSGTVWNSFDDILILASDSLPKKQAEKLEPWDLPNLVAYSQEYLSGFRVESYRVDLEEGFERAQGKTEKVIRDTVRRDIGGDHQRVHSVSSAFRDITFKHILLPIWLSAYRYRNKVYRFLVNGRTGEVQGERPWSWAKITLAAIAVAAVVGAGVYYYMNCQQ